MNQFSSRIVLIEKEQQIRGFYSLIIRCLNKVFMEIILLSVMALGFFSCEQDFRQFNRYQSILRDLI